MSYSPAAVNSGRRIPQTFHLERRGATTTKPLLKIGPIGFSSNQDFAANTDVIIRYITCMFEISPCSKVLFFMLLAAVSKARNPARPDATLCLPTDSTTLIQLNQPN
jgi:hypothetical protein